MYSDNENTLGINGVIKKRQQKEQKYFVEIYKNSKKDQNVFTIMIICGIKKYKKTTKSELKIQIKNMKGY